MLPEPFYDEVNRWTYKSNIFMDMKDVRTSRSEMMKIRMWLRQAHRYVMEDDMTVALTEASNPGDVDQFKYWSLLARLPHDVMWLEFDQHVRLGIADKLKKLDHGYDPSQVSQFCGFLLIRDPQSHAKWLAIEFQRLEGEVISGPIAFVFDPDGVATIDMISEPEDLTNVSALGYTHINDLVKGHHFQGHEYSLLGFADPENKDRTMAPEWALNKVGAVLDPLWMNQFKKAQEVGGQRFKQFGNVIVETLNENRGSLRFLITVLAAMNNVPTTTRVVKPRRGYKPVGMNKVPFLDASVINLMLPKTRKIDYIRNKIKMGYAKHRRHSVTGYYRRVTRNSSRVTTFCHHVPLSSSSSEHIICARCNHEIIWVASYERGDSNLGWVDHSYRITGSSKKGRF